MIEQRGPESRVTAALGLAAGLAAGVLATGAATPAWAQYFGGNKVRYEDPDFHVLATEHFDIYAYSEEDARAADAAVLMERWNTRLSGLLDHELRGRQPLILYAGHPHFRQTNATPGEIGEGTGGFTEMFKRRIVLPFAGAARETDHVLGHELVHAFQFDISKKVQEAKERGRGSGALRLPLWFIEGMAEYLSLGSVDTHTAMWMRDAVLNDDLPTVATLDRSRYFPYRYGHAFWAYVGGRYGDEAIPRLLRTASKVGDAERAIKLELKVSPKDLSKDWQEALKAEFGPAVAAAHAATDYGRVLVKAKKGKGGFNLSPSLSPDGKRLLFFSERELFSIELYLLDVESGKVLRRITSAATDPHLDSLQFLSSAGGWSPDGKRIVIGSVGQGRPALTLVDAETGDTVAEHKFPDLVEVLHPAWSPDGKSIAFAANQGGLLQLMLFDLETGKRRALTQPPFTALQPAWSPDGKRLAFVTDRFTSDSRRLTYGEFRLARLDLASGEVTPLPGLSGGKNINPHWSADGKEIYFVSDARGSPNLYRLEVGSGAIEALTDLKTGISGLTKLSPALSVAAQAPTRIAASVFEKGMYSIYLLENLKGQPVAPASPTLRAGALPPRERVEPKVDRVLAEAEPAVEAVKLDKPKPYDPDMGLDYASQVNAVVGTSNAGSFYGGGIALYWSDMLGDHNLLTQVQFEGDTQTWDRNLAAIASYENREHRWRWGAAAGQVPSVDVAYDCCPTVDIGGGQQAIRERLIRQWQINRDVALRTAYPFTRADRVEGSVGLRHISYVTDAVEQYFDPNNGQFLGSQVVDLQSPASLDLYPAGVAFVHDTSVFGGTAPADGQRYRVEFGGVVGSLSYYAPLIDFRQYYLPFQYLTLAGRVLHYGRYGAEAEDPRLGDVYVGSPTLVRGYESGSFDLNECDPAAAPACPAFDQLFGSRIAVASAEARVPILGARGLIRSPAAPPIDIAAFYDTGVAWNSAEEARFMGGPREAVSSYGASVRLNLFGVIVLQWNYVKPLDRPLQDWYWQFFFAPGF